jgi:hypothetical protein
LCPGARQACSDALLDAPALELGDGPENVHLQLPGRCGGIDPLAKGHERNSPSLQVLEKRNQVLQVAARAVQPPADEHVKPTAFGVSN